MTKKPRIAFLPFILFLFILGIAFPGLEVDAATASPPPASTLTPVESPAATATAPLVKATRTQATPRTPRATRTPKNVPTYLATPTPTALPTRSAEPSLASQSGSTNGVTVLGFLILLITLLPTILRWRD